MKKKIFLGLLIILTSFVVTGCFKTDDLFIKSAEELIDFDFGEYVVSSKGSIKDGYVNITFELNNDKINEFKSEFKNKVINLEEKELDNLKGTNIYKDVTNFCEISNIDTFYQTFAFGEVAKSRSIYVSLCTKDDKYFLNIMG